MTRSLMNKIVITDLFLLNQEFINILDSLQLETISGGKVYLAINNFYYGINNVVNTSVPYGNYNNFIHSIDNSRNSYNYVYII